MDNNFSSVTLTENTFDFFKSTSWEKNIKLWNNNVSYTSLLEGGDYRFNFQTEKENGNIKIYFLCPIRDTSTSIDLDLRIHHSNNNITITIVSLVYSNQKTVINASIFMQEGVQNSNASLLEETIILSPMITVSSLPVLNIHAKNIQASHGAKIYRLDEEKLFYLQSKGLSYPLAQNILIQSYWERLFEQTSLSEEQKNFYMNS